MRACYGFINTFIFNMLNMFFARKSTNRTRVKVRQKACESTNFRV